VAIFVVLLEINTTSLAAFANTALDAGYVTKTFFVPALKFTALPPLLDEMIVVRLRVVPLAV